ncbi:MAG: ribbon-helix-helix domain-containing protein [Caulobacter sp.]|nr:ribbon-helix-helix domain-containing protein [Caulobacter sp.]
MTSRVLTAHVPTDLADKVDEAAARLDRSRAWIVKQALSAWLDREERRHQMTLDALAQVDGGETIDHEVVMEWASKFIARHGEPQPG